MAAAADADRREGALRETEADASRRPADVEARAGKVAAREASVSQLHDDILEAQRLFQESSKQLGADEEVLKGVQNALISEREQVAIERARMEEKGESLRRQTASIEQTEKLNAERERELAVQREALSDQRRVLEGQVETVTRKEAEVLARERENEELAVKFRQNAARAEELHQLQLKLEKLEMTLEVRQQAAAEKEKYLQKEQAAAEALKAEGAQLSEKAKEGVVGRRSWPRVSSRPR